jgi:alkylhydroperoxidase family enzyme
MQLDEVNRRAQPAIGGSRLMPTLRFRRFDEIPPDDQQHVAFLHAQMHGQEEINGIFGAQAHWPAYLAANHKQAVASYQLQGVLPRLTKEAMHVAISTTNGCDF